jgi:hypothetical protein
MPAEIRHILFTHAETLEAAIDHLRRAKQALPRGQVVDTGFAELGPGLGSRFTFKVAPDGNTGPPRPCTIEGEALVTALINYCKVRGIPLPMRAEKRLQSIGNRIGLVMSFGAKGGETLSVE